MITFLQEELLMSLSGFAKGLPPRTRPEPITMPVSLKNAHRVAKYKKQQMAVAQEQKIEHVKSNLAVSSEAYLREEQQRENEKQAIVTAVYKQLKEAKNLAKELHEEDSISQEESEAINKQIAQLRKLLQGD